MDAFILGNLDRYRQLVSRLPQEDASDTGDGKVPHPDMVVGTRIRPLLADEVSAGLPEAIYNRRDHSGVLDLHELRRMVRGPAQLKSSKYISDRVYDASVSTEQIYQELVHPLVQWACGGGIATLFAYGQTGSGKTFTVTEIQKQVAQSLMSREVTTDREVYLTIVELAGNTAFDLLALRNPVSVLEDSFGATQLHGAVEHRIESADHLLGYTDKAAAFRRTESTNKNDQSSRSHAIFRIRVKIPSITSTPSGVLYIIDLAGSEAARDMEHHSADRMRETRDINKSLSILKDCVRGKAEADAQLEHTTGRKVHIPFRHSALTKILKPVFDLTSDRVCKTVVIACVNPSILDAPATRNTLRYLEMLRVLVPQTEKMAFSPLAPASWSNAELRDWIDKESGRPAIDSAILAPNETGYMLLRLPEPEFELRCLKTPGVLPEQAKAFRFKLWSLHVDWQRERNATSKDVKKSQKGFKAKVKTTSREPDSMIATRPFKERICPGMAVRWTQPAELNLDLPTGMLIAIVLCPASAAGQHARDSCRDVENTSLGEQGGSGNTGRYLCAVVTRGFNPSAYELNLWHQVVVEVGWMDDEVILQYDQATRYYYLAV